MCQRGRYPQALFIEKKSVGRNNFSCIFFSLASQTLAGASFETLSTLLGSPALPYHFLTDPFCSTHLPQQVPLQSGSYQSPYGGSLGQDQHPHKASTTSRHLMGSPNCDSYPSKVTPLWGVCANLTR